MLLRRESMKAYHQLKSLKIACLEQGIPQRKLARMVGIHESVLSNAIAGRWVLTELQQKRIAEILNKPSEDLFPNP